MTVTPGPPGTSGTSGADDASIGQLASRLSEQVSRLVHDELALAQMEAKSKAKKLGVGVGMFGVSGVLAFFGAACLIAAAVLGLSRAIDPWLAALCVAAALLLIAGLVALVGKKGVTSGSPPIPTQAVESTKADVAAVREAVKR